MTQLSNALGFRADLQGLRAVAVSVVVLAHANVPGFAGGFVGVDVFFVLSGYLITRILADDDAGSSLGRYVGFISRRLRRLFPALAVMVVGSVLLAYLFLPPADAVEVTSSAVSALTWTSNFFFALRDVGYFDALAGRDLFLHTWSLAVEEQFYLLWPILIFTVATSARSQHRRLTLLLAAILVGTFALSALWLSRHPQLVFYMMPARAWEFALGAIAYSAFEHRTFAARHQSLAVFAGAVGTLLIAAAVVLLEPGGIYPGWRALAPSVGAFLLIAAGHIAPHSGLSGMLGWSPLVWIGDRSYSIYLWHWPLLSILVVPGAAQMSIPFAVTATVAFAAASFRFVEQPFRYGRYSRVTPGRTIILTGAVMFAAIVALVPIRSGIEVVAEAQVTGNYNPRVDGPGIYGPGSPCDSGQFSDQVVPCVNGAADAPRSAVLLGDSIGAQWLSALPELFPPPDWQVIVLTKSACPIVDVDYVYAAIGRTYDVCARWRSGVIEYLRGLRPDILFVGSAADYPFSPEEWITGSERIFASLASLSGRTVVIAGTPRLGFDGPGCLGQRNAPAARWLGWDAERCTRTVEADAAWEVAGHLRGAAASFSSVDVVDWRDVVCPNNLCSAIHEGTVVFRDDKHVTDSFVRSRIGAIRESLATLGLFD